MSMNVILPKRGARIPTRSEVPLFFLAGPVRGGGDWQAEMCQLLEREMEGADFFVAIPQRYEVDHPLVELRVKNGKVFERQLEWEQHYMERAAWGPGPGCLIFWLAEQKGFRDPGEGPYARDTLGEVGRWVAHKKYRPETRLVIGGGEDFSGLDVIERNILHDLGHFDVHRIMSQTAMRAVRTVLEAAA